MLEIGGKKGGGACVFAQQNKGKHQLFHLDTRCIILKINNLTSRPDTLNIHECWETKFYKHIQT